MIRTILTIQFILVATYNASILAGPMIQVGEQKLSKDDFVAQMEELNYGPEQTVEWLKEEEAVKQFAKAKGITKGKTRNGLYSALFGVNYDEDVAQSRLRDIPLAKRKIASLRVALLRRVLAETADKSVPVVYHDLDAFWELIKATPEYRVREESGLSLKPESMKYTWAELMVDSASVVASRDDSPLVTGDLFNQYCVRFARQLQGINSRRRTIAEVRKEVAEVLVEHLLAVNYAEENKWSLSDREKAVAAKTYTQRNLFTQDVKLKDLKIGATYKKVTEDLHNLFKEKHADKIQMISNGSAKTNITASNYVPFLYTCQQYKDRVIEEIAQTLTQDQVYEWMQTSEFAGSFGRAREEFAKSTWKKVLSELKREQNVGISSSL